METFKTENLLQVEEVMFQSALTASTCFKLHYNSGHHWKYEYVEMYVMRALFMETAFIVLHIMLALQVHINLSIMEYGENQQSAGDADTVNGYDQMSF